MRFHYRSCRSAVSCFIGLVLMTSLAVNVHAQTATAITPNGLGTTAPRSGNTINIQGGRQSGPNLFHSFSQFNLGAADTANFVQPSGATNVISRVTGAKSFIDGTLQANGWSNFYFVNPNGIVFGPTAKLNISGSAYFSSAHYLRLGEGDIFSTRSGTVGTELLSSSPVSSFGFLQGIAAAPITITGSKLTVGSGQTLSVVGGPITIDGAQLSAPNGKVQVASVNGVLDGRSVSYQTEIVRQVPLYQTVPVYDPSGEFIIRYETKIIGYKDVTERGTQFLGYGGEVSSSNIVMSSLNVGNITMSPGTSFASLDAGPNGTVQTVPAAANIQTPAGSQKIVQGNLVKAVTAPILDNISSNLTVEEGETQTIIITLNKPAEITETVTLSNSNPGSATTNPVPGPNIQFRPGEQTKTVQVTGVKEGATQLTATLRGIAKSAGVTVLQRLAISENLTPAVELGVSGTLTIALNRTSSTPTVVTVENLNPEVGTLSTNSITFNPNQTTAPSVAVSSITVGTVTIRATLGKASVEKSMQVTPMSVTSLNGVSVLEGQAGTGTVTIPRNAPSTVRISLQSADTSIAALDSPFVDIPGGKNSATFTIRGVTEGSVQLRAQSGNSTQTAAVVVNALPPPPLSSLSPNLSLKVGNSGSIAVVLKETFKKDLTVLLKSADPSIASVTESVTIPANSTTSQPVVVAGNGAGRTTIIATLLTSSVQASVDVSSVAPPLAQATPEIGAASQTIGLAAAAQYPRALAAPQGLATVPRLLADKCGAMKEGQFSSFAQLNRDSSPSQPGRYLSAPVLLEGEQTTGAREPVPEISIMVGPPKVLTVHPDVMSFIALAQDCRLEFK